MLGAEERLTGLVNMVAIHKLLEEVSDVFYTAQWELDRIDYLHTLSKELFEAHAHKKHEETKRLIEELEHAGATIEYGRRGRIKRVTFPKQVIDIEANKEAE